MLIISICCLQEPNEEFPLNVDVKEFYPRKKLEALNVESAKIAKPVPAVAKHTNKISKKDIIEGIKSMEQQNIDLMATKNCQKNTVLETRDDWNVIKKGKQVKVVKADQSPRPTEIEAEEPEVTLDCELKVEDQKKDIAPAAKKEAIAKTVKSKKTKSKSKKRKSLMVKQDGFQITEPEFGKSTKQPLIMTPILSDEDVSEPEDLVEISNEVEIFAVESQKSNCEDFETVKTDKITDDVVIDINDEDIRSTSTENCSHLVQNKLDLPKSVVSDSVTENFQDMEFFNDRTNIAALERDLLENLRLFDEEIDLKSPIINPLYDFPITSAVQKWLHTKQNESFESLFALQNFEKLTEFYEEDDIDDDDLSDISDFQLKSETDSDYSSDFHTKTSSPNLCSAHARKPPSEKLSKCNKIAKNSFCALM